MQAPINIRMVLKYTQSIGSEAMLNSIIRKPPIFCIFQYIWLNRYICYTLLCITYCTYKDKMLSGLLKVLSMSNSIVSCVRRTTKNLCGTRSSKKILE